MLRKRAKSIDKGQQMSTTEGDVEISLQRQKTNNFVNEPSSLVIGLSCMSAVLDCEYSVRSPTSPLDFKLFPTTRFPKPCLDGHKKCWVCSKVGLSSIVDSPHYNDHINVDDGKFGVSRGTVFGSQVRSEARNWATNEIDIVSEAPAETVMPQECNLKKGSSGVLFEIGGNPLGSDSIGKLPSFSLDSERVPSGMCRLGGVFAADVIANSTSCSKLITLKGQVDNVLGDTLEASEIEESEDYTCVITHGPNPKTTHIFGDCVLGCHPNLNGIVCKNKIGNHENTTLEIPCTCLSNDFLSYCDFCEKKLEGKDIYMYRGEKAFCSWDCRLEGISIQDQKEHSIRKPVESKTKDKTFDESIFVAI